MGNFEPLPTPVPNVKKLNESNCGPPWECEGSGGWCGCECYCCPPCPCYTGEFKGCMEAGSKKTDWFKEGCECSGDCSSYLGKEGGDKGGEPPQITPTPEITPSATPIESLPSPEKTSTPTPTPSPTPTPTPITCSDCVGWWKNLFGECVYTGDPPGTGGVAAPVGTTVYTGPNGQSNCNSFGMLETQEICIDHVGVQLEAQKNPNIVFNFENKENNLGVPFPNFDYDPSQDFKFNPEINEYVDEEGNTVKVLNNECSIPCSYEGVSASFSGCCMLNTLASAGGNTITFSFKAAKEGTVIVNSPDKVGCASVKTFINGEELKSKFIEECTEVEILIIAIAEPPDLCCEVCTFVDEAPRNLIPECVGSAGMIQVLNKKTGDKKIIINKKNLIKKIN